jgi:alpha-glucosidase
MIGTPNDKYTNLNYKSLPLELQHYGNLAHKDVHNLYGMMDMIYTYLTLKEQLKQPQPFILSRSTFPGSGKFGFHWTGDNHADFDFLRVSLV